MSIDGRTAAWLEAWGYLETARKLLERGLEAGEPGDRAAAWEAAHECQRQAFLYAALAGSPDTVGANTRTLLDPPVTQEQARGRAHRLFDRFDKD